MDNVKNDQYYAVKLLGDLEFIVGHMDGVDAEELAKKMEPPVRLELTTYGLQNRCSTN